MTGTNPFGITVVESLERLRAAYDDTFCRLGAKEPTYDELKHLERMAPDWPKGKDAFRSFQVRPVAFGEGRDGMIATFEATCAAVKRIHTRFWRYEMLLSGMHPYKGEGVDRLRLLNGNLSHKPVLRWVTFDLSANRDRLDVTSVRSPQSLADEGLFAARMFPKREEVIDFKKKSAWFCAGYELNVPEDGDEPWRRMPCVNRRMVCGSACLLDAGWRGDGYSGYSVPLLGE